MSGSSTIKPGMSPAQRQHVTSAEAQSQQAELEEGRIRLDDPEAGPALQYDPETGLLYDEYLGDAPLSDGQVDMVAPMIQEAAQRDRPRTAMWQRDAKRALHAKRHQRKTTTPTEQATLAAPSAPPSRSLHEVSAQQLQAVKTAVAAGDLPGAQQAYHDAQVDTRLLLQANDQSLSVGEKRLIKGQLFVQRAHVSLLHTASLPEGTSRTKRLSVAQRHVNAALKLLNKAAQDSTVTREVLRVRTRLYQSVGHHDGAIADARVLAHTSGAKPSDREHYWDVMRAYVQHAHAEGYLTQDMIEERQLQRYVAVRPAFGTLKSALQFKITLAQSGDNKDVATMERIVAAAKLGEHDAQAQNASSAIDQHYHRAQAAILRGDNIQAQLELYAVKDAANVASSKESQPIVAHAMSQLRSYTLGTIDTLHNDLEAMRDQRYADLTEGPGSMEQVKRQLRYVRALRAAVAAGHADTLEEAQRYVEASAVTTGHALRQGAAEGQSVNLSDLFGDQAALRGPEKWERAREQGRAAHAVMQALARDPEHAEALDVNAYPALPSVQLNGGLLQVDTTAMKAVRVIVGPAGGTVVIPGKEQVTLPPSDRSRVIIVDGGHTLHSHETLDRQTGPVLPLALRSHTDTDQAVGARGVSRLTALYGRDALREQTDVTRASAFHLAHAQKLRGRSGSYTAAARALKRVFQPALDAELANVPQSVIDEARADALSRRSDIVDQVRSQLAHLQSVDPDTYHAKYPHGDPSPQEIGLMVDAQIESAITAAMQNDAFARLHDKRDQLDPTQRQAWEQYRNMMDPLRETLVVSDEGLNRALDEVVIALPSMPLAVGVGAAIRGLRATEAVAKFAAPSMVRSMGVNGAIYATSYTAEGLVLAGTHGLMTGQSPHAQMVSSNVYWSFGFHGASALWGRVAGNALSRVAESGATALTRNAAKVANVTGLLTTQASVGTAIETLELAAHGQQSPHTLTESFLAHLFRAGGYGAIGKGLDRASGGRIAAMEQRAAQMQHAARMRHQAQAEHKAQGPDGDGAPPFGARVLEAGLRSFVAAVRFGARLSGQKPTPPLLPLLGRLSLVSGVGLGGTAGTPTPKTAFDRFMSGKNFASQREAAIAFLQDIQRAVTPEDASLFAPDYRRNRIALDRSHDSHVREVIDALNILADEYGWAPEAVAPVVTQRTARDAQPEPVIQPAAQIATEGLTATATTKRVTPSAEASVAKGQEVAPGKAAAPAKSKAEPVVDHLDAAGDHFVSERVGDILRIHAEDGAHAELPSVIRHVDASTRHIVVETTAREMSSLLEHGVLDAVLAEGKAITIHAEGSSLVAVGGQLIVHQVSRSHAERILRIAQHADVTINGADFTVTRNATHITIEGHGDVMPLVETLTPTMVAGRDVRIQSTTMKSPRGRAVFDRFAENPSVSVEGANFSVTRSDARIAIKGPGDVMPLVRALTPEMVAGREVRIQSSTLKISSVNALLSQLEARQFKDLHVTAEHVTIEYQPSSKALTINGGARVAPLVADLPSSFVRGHTVDVTISGKSDSQRNAALGRATEALQHDPKVLSLHTNDGAIMFRSQQENPSTADSRAVGRTPNFVTHSMESSLSFHQSSASVAAYGKAMTRAVLGPHLQEQALQRFWDGAVQHVRDSAGKDSSYNPFTRNKDAADGKPEHLWADQWADIASRLVEIGAPKEMAERLEIARHEEYAGAELLGGVLQRMRDFEKPESRAGFMGVARFADFAHDANAFALMAEVQAKPAGLFVQFLRDAKNLLGEQQDAGQNPVTMYGAVLPVLRDSTHTNHQVRNPARTELNQFRALRDGAKAANRETRITVIPTDRQRRGGPTNEAVLEVRDARGAWKAVSIEVKRKSATEALVEARNGGWPRNPERYSLNESVEKGFYQITENAFTNGDTGHVGVLFVEIVNAPEGTGAELLLAAKSSIEWAYANPKHPRTRRGHAALDRSAVQVRIVGENGDKYHVFTHQGNGVWGVARGPESAAPHAPSLVNR